MDGKTHARQISKKGKTEISAAKGLFEADIRGRNALVSEKKLTQDILPEKKEDESFDQKFENLAILKKLVHGSFGETYR